MYYINRFLSKEIL